MLLIDRKPWKRKALQLAVIIYGICYLYIVIIYRLPQSETVLILTPFNSYAKAFKFKGDFLSNYVIRAIILNIFLFIPLGMIVSSLFNGKVVLPFLIGVAIAIVTEITQYVAHLGWAEFDDVFNNSLGMLIGIWIYRALKLMLSKRE